MGVKGLSCWVTGIILLGSIAFANSQACKDKGSGSSNGAIKCPPGTTLTDERRYMENGKPGNGIGHCCVPGSAEEKERIGYAKKVSCKTVCNVPEVENPCEEYSPINYFIQGEKVIFEEMKREPGCVGSNNQNGTAVYCCPKDSLESALSSAIGAEPHEFPHMALYNRGLGEQCGATVYNKRWLIIAAHCVVDGSEHVAWEVDSSFTIKLGRNLGTINNPRNEYTVIKTVPHPDYTDLKGHPELKKEMPLTYNDIAMIQLDRDIEFGPNVKALAIAPKGFVEEKYAEHSIVAGWGRTDTLKASENLQKANFVVHSDESCFKKNNAPFGYQRENADKIFCIGGIFDGVWGPSAANGDSGGPAICRGADGTPVLCGVASYIGSEAKDCMENQDEKNCPPNVFTEVDVFADWIKSVAKEQDPDTLYKPQLYGEVVKSNQVDHQVRITSTSRKSCGGTLIAPDTVVTAASCIASVDDGGKILPGLKVWSGVTDISSSGGNSHSIKSISTLDGFKRNEKAVDIAEQGNRVWKTDNYYTNNLGIIKLGEPAKVGGNLPKLPQQNEEPSSPALEYSFPRNASRGGELRRREFVLLDKKDCQARWNHLGLIGMVKKVDDNVLCGVEKYSGGSICDRELGGGLICKGKDGKETLCGVQVQRLCEYTIPNDFINVGMHSNWLEKAKA